MPKRRAQNASTTTTAAWKKRDRKRVIRLSLERQQEGHEVDVLLGGQHLAEGRGHDALRVPGHRAHGGRVQNLGHDVLGRLDLRDLGEVRPDLPGGDLVDGVAGEADRLAREQGLARLRVAGERELGRRGAPTPARSGARVPFSPILWQISHVPLVWKISSPNFTSCAGETSPPSSDSSAGGLDSICGIELAK